MQAQPLHPLQALLHNLLSFGMFAIDFTLDAVLGFFEALSGVFLMIPGAS